MPSYPWSLSTQVNDTCRHAGGARTFDSFAHLTKYIRRSLGYFKLHYYGVHIRQFLGVLALSTVPSMSASTSVLVTLSGAGMQSCAEATRLGRNNTVQCVHSRIIPTKIKTGLCLETPRYWSLYGRAMTTGLSTPSTTSPMVWRHPTAPWRQMTGEDPTPTTLYVTTTPLRMPPYSGVYREILKSKITELRKKWAHR